MPYHYHGLERPQRPSGLRIVERTSDDYATACTLFNRALTQTPAWIAYPYDEREVAEAVSLARSDGLSISVRSGGHDYEGFSVTDGSAVIDMSRCDRISVSEDGARCFVGPGVTLRKLYHVLFNAGMLSLPGGTCGSVGVAGLTLGGGFGNLGRLHGLLCDRLRRVKIVDARGGIVESHGDAGESDLLWASCGGGGGNFGVVTEFEFEPLTVPENVTTFSFKWRWSDENVRSLFSSYERWVLEAPREIGATLVITSKAWNTLHFLGQSLLDQGRTREAIADIVNTLSNPTEQIVTSVGFLEQMENYAGTDYASTSWKMASTFSADAISDDGLGAMIGVLEVGPPGTLIAFDALGGAVADLESGATAFPHRTQRLLWQYQAYWSDANQAETYRAWVERAFLAIDPFTSQVSYRNYCDVNLTDWERRYYQSNYARLQQIKARLDPENFFRYPQSIRLPSS